MVEYHPISPRDKARIHEFGKKVLPGIFLGFESVAVRIWKGHFLIADLEDLEKMNASYIYIYMSSTTQRERSVDKTNR